MPEKPEVITVANAIKPKIINKTITSAFVYWDNIIATPSVSEFKEKIKNKTVKDVTTRGKFIIINLGSVSLLIHLRMEGKFTFREKNDPLNKHEHVIFNFSDDKQMRFYDVRKFGKIYLIDTINLYKDSPLVNLGYEYNDLLLTKEYLYNKLKSKNIPIKTSLLDQSIIAGIGNIYDDEILFLSKISPYTKSKDITLDEALAIIKNTNIILDKAIKLGGTTIKSFTSSEGVHGKFQNSLLVHGKKGEICSVCREKIVKVKINGRGTYYCPNCQKEVKDEKENKNNM